MTHIVIDGKPPHSTAAGVYDRGGGGATRAMLDRMAFKPLDANWWFHNQLDSVL